MKVSCPSCEAKYNIADDKIKGKKVKVRCKSCGTQLLVDGNSSQVSSVAPPDDANAGNTAHSSPPAALDDSATSDAWTVNFSDTDERTLTTAEIAELAGQGQLPDEVFVWKDGMGDWQLVTSVPELASAIAAARRSPNAKPSSARATSSDSKPPPAVASGATVGPIVAAPGSALAKKMASAKTAAAQKKAAEAGGAKPEASEDAVGQKVSPGAVAAKKSTTEPPPAHKSAPDQSLSPKAATKLSGKRQTGTHDLFAAIDKAGSEIDVDTSDADREPAKATGARNENSVLFSLDALKSGMLGGAAAAIPSQQSQGPRRKAPGAPTKRLEDLMTVDMPGPAFGRGGGLLLGGNDALLAAPPPPPPPPKPEPKPEPVQSSSVEFPAPGPRKSRLGLVIVLAIGLVALGAGGAFLALKSTDDGAKEATAAGAASTPAAASGPAQEALASAAPAASAAPVAVAQNEADAGVPSAGSSAPPQPVAVAKGGASRPGAGKPSGVAEPKPTEKKPEPRAADPAPAGAGGFNKEAAVAALSVAASQATVCKRPEGPWGSGKAVVTFASSGRVTTANVTGEPFGGTAVGGCVAGVFRRAKIPAFSGDPVTVSKSFTIAP